MSANTTTVREAVMQILRDAKATTVFGNPGSTELAFLGDWPEDFHYVLGLQEGGAVGMAEGVARVTGRATFVNLHSAAGVGNAMGNIFTAYKNQTPMVILAGQQARSLLTSEAYLAADDAAEFPRPYVKWSAQPASAQDVPAAVARAFEIANQPPYGPTFVSVPSDDWDQPVQPLSLGKVVPLGTAREEGLKEVAEILKSAKRPALVLGTEVDIFNAYEQVTKLAEKTNATAYIAPVAAAAVFPEDHPQFGGFLPAIPGGLSTILEPHDVVFVVGAPVFTFHVDGDSPVLHSDSTRIVQLTADPNAAARARVELSLVGELATSVEELLTLLPDTPTADKSGIVAVKRTEPDGSTELPSAAYVLSRLGKIMPKDAIIVEEAPSHRPAMQQNLPITHAGGFYTMASGGLGYGLPASIGVGLANRDTGHKVIGVIGDGSMQYCIQSLWTAAQEDVPVTFVVLNNHGYGALKSFSQLLGAQNTPGMDLPDIDLVQLAQSYGCNASRVEKTADLEDALNKALSDPRPHLIDVVVDPNQGNVY